MKKVIYFVIMALFMASGASGQLIFDDDYDPGIIPPADSQDTPDVKEAETRDPVEFSGHYVFDGKVYFYDQKTGEFTPLSNGPQDRNRGLSDSLLHESQNFETQLNKPVSLASLARGSQGFDNELITCKDWVSVLLGDSTFRSQEECKDALEKKKEEALVNLDDFVEGFEKTKRAISINLEYDGYKKISSYKLSTETSINIINQVFSKGCHCKD